MMQDESANGAREEQPAEAITSEVEKTEKPNEEATETKESCRKRLSAFYTKNEFLVLVVVVILIALAYPPLGAVYLYPQITATWIAVVFIFLMSGLGLKTEELAKALHRVYFNSFVQIFNFLVVSSIVFGTSRLLSSFEVLSPALADGMVICSCLPITVNMVMVLTKASGGDEAAAVFNAAFGNMVGVFLTPVLIVMYLGVEGSVDIGKVFYKLALRVLLPIFVGQILQKTSTTVVAFVKKYKPRFKKAQVYCLVFIVYTVFCKTFTAEQVASVGDVFLMIFLQGVLLVIVMTLAWVLLRVFFSKEPQLRVMGLFGCTHKTVAMGVPLIGAIYEDNPNVGFYTLPLLVWHPMQLLIGTALSPRLSLFVDGEVERLGLNTKDNVKEQDGRGTSNPIDVEGGVELQQSNLENN